MEDQKQNQEPKFQPEKNDVAKNKALAIVGYIIPILFFIPLLTEAKESKFAKFHANQQLLLLLWWVVGCIVSAILVFVLIGILLYFIVFILGIVFLIMGIVNAARGEMKELPLIGGIKILN